MIGKGQRPAVMELGAMIGFGNMMQLASSCWREHLGPPLEGGEFVVGPCRGSVVDCPDASHGTEDEHCDWCCGCGWVTQQVAEQMKANLS